MKSLPKEVIMRRIVSITTVVMALFLLVGAAAASAADLNPGSTSILVLFQGDHGQLPGKDLTARLQFLEGEWRDAVVPQTTAIDGLEPQFASARAVAPQGLYRWSVGDWSSPAFELVPGVDLRVYLTVNAAGANFSFAPKETILFEEKNESVKTSHSPDLIKVSIVQQPSVGTDKRAEPIVKEATAPSPPPTIFCKGKKEGPPCDDPPTPDPKAPAPTSTPTPNETPIPSGKRAGHGCPTPRPGEIIFC